jgi:Tol biopolymer transport system component
MRAVAAALLLVSISPGQEQSSRRRSTSADPCAVRSLKKSPLQGFRVPSPDGRQFLVNKEDEEGVAQIYIGREGSDELNCITCTERPGGPKRKRFKMQPRWHPSGRWIFIAVEREKYSPPPLLSLSRRYVEGQLQNGLFTNMYAISIDGRQWHRLTDFRSGKKGTPDGYTGPAFTPDGKHALWSQAVDGNIFKYHPFGRWELILADFDDSDGNPRFSNLRNITPPGMHWNEPGNFHPDGQRIIFSGSDQKDAQGMDQFVLNIRTGQLDNLTNSPKVWDEHGVFSPDGEKVVFMSAHPYRNDAKASKVLSIRTEFMLINSDGSDLRQLTRFRERGSPEFGDGIAANGVWSKDGRSINAKRLFFPNYEYWDIVFEGNCGNRSAQ